MGDGRLGFPEGAPYDAIHVGAAAPTIPKAVRTHMAYFHKYRIEKNNIKLFQKNFTPVKVKDPVVQK